MNNEIFGVFDGQSMAAPDGRQYPVPANYASKSKLVEGDAMKLIITEEGQFIYKQINPVERRMEICKLIMDHDNNQMMVKDKLGNYFKINKAAVTFHHAMEGDEAVCVFPKNAMSEYAVIEGVITSRLNIG